MPASGASLWNFKHLNIFCSSTFTSSFLQEDRFRWENVPYRLHNGIWDLHTQKLLLKIHPSQRLKPLVKI